MSRWTDRLDAWRAMTRKKTVASASASMKTGSPMNAFGRTTVWLDGGQARVSGAAGGATGHERSPVALTSAGDVNAALKAIEALAPAPRGPSLHRLRVVAGAPFARYHALPWRALPKPQDWTPAARLQAVQTGAAGDSWRYAVTDGAWGQGRLAAAMPEALCAGIERMCKARRWPAPVIEPAFTFALAKHASRIRDGDIAIIVLEETEGDTAIAQIGLRRGGGWAAFIALPLSARGGSLDDVLCDAFALCAGASPERRYVIAPGGPQRWNASAADADWLPAPWDSLSPDAAP